MLADVRTRLTQAATRSNLASPAFPGSAPVDVFEHSVLSRRRGPLVFTFPDSVREGDGRLVGRIQDEFVRAFAEICRRRMIGGGASIVDALAAPYRLSPEGYAAGWSGQISRDVVEPDEPELSSVPAGRRIPSTGVHAAGSGM